MGSDPTTPPGPTAARDARRRRSSADAAGPAAIAPELTPAERAAALSRLGDAAPAGEGLDPSRFDAARARLRAAVAVPEPSAAPTPVDPGRFDAAQARLRAGRPGGRRKPA